MDITLDYLNITRDDLEQITSAFRERNTNLWRKTNEDWTLKHESTNKPFRVLAISYGHEANATLMVNGEIIASAAKERFTKQKCQMNYPKNSINFCLKWKYFSQ